MQHSRLILLQALIVMVEQQCFLSSKNKTNNKQLQIFHKTQRVSCKMETEKIINLLNDSSDHPLSLQIKNVTLLIAKQQTSFLKKNRTPPSL